MPHTHEVSWWNRIQSSVACLPRESLASGQVGRQSSGANGAVIAPARQSFGGSPPQADGAIPVTRDAYQSSSCAIGDPKCIINALSNFKLPLLFGGLAFLPVKERAAGALNYAGDKQGAIDILEGVARGYAELGEHRSAASSFWSLGSIKMELGIPASGDFDAAADQYKAANDTYRRIMALKMRGKAHEAIGEFGDAGLAYIEAVGLLEGEKDFNPTEMYLLAGRAFDRADQLESAAFAFGKAAEGLEATNGPHFIVEAGAVRMDHANILQQNNKPDEAKAMFDRAAETFARVTDMSPIRGRLNSDQLHRALFLRGMALEGADRPGEAVEAYLKLYERHLDISQDGWQMMELGRYRAVMLLAKGGDHERAADILSAIVGGLKRSPADLDLLGDAWLDLGRELKDGKFYAEAVDNLTLAVESIGKAVRRHEEPPVPSGDHAGMVRYLRGLQDEGVNLIAEINEDAGFKDLNRIIDDAIDKKGRAMEELARAIGVHEQELEYALRDRAGRPYKLLRRKVGAARLGQLVDSHFDLQNVRPMEEQRREDIERGGWHVK